MEPEVRVFVGKDLGLAGPEGMRHLQPVGRIRGTQFPGLDEEGEETRDQQEQKERTRKWPKWHSFDSNGAAPSGSGWK
jgi:hypothetical protein